MAVYAASKAALISYSEALHKALLPFNINVTCLCPSVVNTDMTYDGRMDNAHKIQTDDLVNAIRFLLAQRQQISIPRMDIHCKALDIGISHGTAVRLPEIPC